MREGNLFEYEDGYAKMEVWVEGKAIWLSVAKAGKKRREVRILWQAIPALIHALNRAKEISLENRQTAQEPNSTTDQAQPL